MPKRAVMISFELWKDWMTEGYRSGDIECTKGLPEDAELVDLFTKGAGLTVVPDLVAVFESPDFEPVKDGEYKVISPRGEEYGAFDPEWTRHYEAQSQ